MMAETALSLPNAPEGSDTVLQTTSLHLQPDDQTEMRHVTDHSLAMTNIGMEVITENNMAGSEKHLEKTVMAIGQRMKSSCLQWEQVMAESEHFEVFCPTRVDKLLQEARALEGHLLNQKEQLINRLRNLSQTLQVVS